MRSKPILALALLISACARLTGGATVSDLGDGKYRIETPDSAGAAPGSAANQNAAAARATCPAGYVIIEKNKSAQTLYGSMVLSADTATVWVIKCGAGK
jgi:hypothetical protein